jgi:hypothetical protein
VPCTTANSFDNPNLKLPVKLKSLMPNLFGAIYMPHRIIISGIYRSGTSLTAELVHRWGAYVGQESDIFQDEYGYLEHLALQKLNDELINDNSRVPTPVDELLTKAQDPILKERALQILAAMDKETEENGANAWVWKDPRLPLVIPFWEQMWGDAIYVVPVRHPVETIYSAAKMDGMEPEQVPLSAGLAYWQFCMLNLLNFTQSSPRKLFISYDQLVCHPQQECARLAHFLDEQCQVKTAGIEKRIETMAAFVASAQRHYQAPQALAEIPVSTPEQRALYNFMRVKCLYPDEAYNPEDFAIYPGWQEYLQAMDMLVSAMNNPQES